MALISMTEAAGEGRAARLSIGKRANAEIIEGFFLQTFATRASSPPQHDLRLRSETPP
jgi:hypothetical protein